MSTTKTETHKKWWQPFATGAGMIILLFMIVIPIAREYYQPSDQAPIRVVTADARLMMRQQAEGITTVLGKTTDYRDSDGLVNFAKWDPKRTEMAKAALHAKNEHDKVIAIASGRIPPGAVAAPFSEANESGPWEFVGPTCLYVGKKWRQLVTDSQGEQRVKDLEDLHPQGLYASGKPAEYIKYRTVMENQNGVDSPWIGYQAPLIRFWKNGEWGPWEFFQTGRPMLEAYTKFEVRPNEWVIEEGQEGGPTSYYKGKSDAYKVWDDKTGLTQTGTCDRN